MVIGPGTGKMYGVIWWETASANLPVSYTEAVRMAREAKDAVEDAGYGGFDEEVLDPEDDVEAGEDEPPESSEFAATGSADGEAGVSEDYDVGDDAVSSDAAESGSQVDGDGTNGWKNLVWERHGIDVAKCMQQASGSSQLVNCPLRVRPR